MMSEKNNIVTTVEEDDEIDVLALARAVLKNFWWIVLAGIIGGAVFLGGTMLLIAPTYRSSFTAYINNQSEQTNSYMSSSDISASKDLTTTYAQIINSKPVIEAAIAKMDKGLCTYEDIENCIDVNTVNSTQILRVDVTTTDPNVSYQLANAMEEVAADQVQEIVSQSSMKIVTHAEFPEEKYGPSYLKFTAVGILLGMLIVIAYSIITFMMDTRVKSAEALAEHYGIPVMGTIHDLSAKEHKGYGNYGYYGGYGSYGENKGN